MLNAYLDIQPVVAEALAAGKPVVALESTIISHGMPYPQNVETARQVEQVVRRLAQLSGHVKTDKAGGAGDQILHGWGPVQIMGLLTVMGKGVARFVAEPARL